MGKGHQAVPIPIGGMGTLRSAHPTFLPFHPKKISPCFLRAFVLTSTEPKSFWFPLPPGEGGKSNSAIALIVNTPSIGKPLLEMFPKSYKYISHNCYS
jgi:hypothetical protein